MRYLLKVDYYCPQVKGRPKDVVIESNEMPEPGIIEERSRFLIPDHRCKRDEYSQACEDDITCNWQQILFVRAID
jgi:hypothetical protein